LGRIQAAAWLAARQSSTAARNTLAGKNIFQLRAAVETVEAATQQQGQQQQPQQVMPLPTSDESETLLRIRHSVSGTKLATAAAAAVQHNQACSDAWQHDCSICRSRSNKTHNG
jgi:hypothetical protein